MSRKFQSEASRCPHERGVRVATPAPRARRARAPSPGECQRELHPGLAPLKGELPSPTAESDLTVRFLL